MRRGEVRYVRLPDTTPRPVLVLTRDVALPVRTKVSVAPLTTRVRGLAIEVPLTPEDDAVPKDCVVTLDNVETLYQSDLDDDVVTVLSIARMRQVCHALRYALDCE